MHQVKNQINREVQENYRKTLKGKQIPNPNVLKSDHSPRQTL